MKHTIFLSIASYRDPDLRNTVRSAYENAKYRNKIFFSIHSQAEDAEHPNLSFIPKENIRYIKSHWSESLGVCWARQIANQDTSSAIFFLQIDSHTRFDKNWDQMAIAAYNKSTEFWGNNIILTTYPHSFTINQETKEERLNSGLEVQTITGFWNEEAKMLWGKSTGKVVKDTVYGDESLFLSAGFLFSKAETMQKIPYDSELYFAGEEASLFIRAYTRNIKLVCPPQNFLYSNYDREVPDRKLHWEDRPNWWDLNLESYKKLKRIMTGDKSLGIYGIESEALFKEYQLKIGVDLMVQNYQISK
jgi:hypothetical protein